MYVTVELHLQPPTTLIRLPERAVRPGKMAWILRDNKLVMVSPLRLIELINLPAVVESADASVEPQRVWVADADASGLKVGERIIVSPLVAAYPQMPVREQTGP
jgi:hypothetical protein